MDATSNEILNARRGTYARPRPINSSSKDARMCNATNDATPRVVRRIIVDTNSWYYACTLRTFAVALCNRDYVTFSVFLALCKTRIVETTVVYKGNVHQISATWLLLTLVCGMQIMIEVQGNLCYRKTYRRHESH